ncbi:uncharacterized protein IL334_002139 [Kwoniella shivajii]|uniref:Uncharacterized protein n=1 Tax=Kwoniella shivajii TaxID=564305 RepID=A0ABZ1CWX5_9TREE|nr:hypothetical protein IL334_002139 [Kwoniella shivajii]
MKMSPLNLLWIGIDRFVGGDVNVIKSKDGKRRYILPACHKDVYRGKYDSRKHGNKKKEDYRCVEFLVGEAKRAMRNGDAQPFFRIYCLFLDIRKQDVRSINLCSTSNLKHLEGSNSINNLDRVIRLDKTALRRLKFYAWAMEGILPSPAGRFRLGTGTLIMAVPYVGSLIIGLINSLICWRTVIQISAPWWLWSEIFLPLFWATFSAFVIPAVGDIAASRISPMRRAARKTSYWLKLRCSFAVDKQDQDGYWVCHSMNRVFPRKKGEEEPYVWKYDEQFRKEIFGNDLSYLWNDRKRFGSGV